MGTRTACDISASYPGRVLNSYLLFTTLLYLVLYIIQAYTQQLISIQHFDKLFGTVNQRIQLVVGTQAEAYRALSRLPRRTLLGMVHKATGTAGKTSPENITMDTRKVIVLVL